LSILAAGSFVSCASGSKDHQSANGPKHHQPASDPIVAEIQTALDPLVSQIPPINIAGKSVKISIEGDYWFGQVDGKDALAGEIKATNTDEGVDLLLSVKWAWIDTGEKNPVTGEELAKWQKSPVNASVTLVYKKGPPATLTTK
jgi:hypothetical protein